VSLQCCKDLDVVWLMRCCIVAMLYQCYFSSVLLIAVLLQCGTVLNLLQRFNVVVVQLHSYTVCYVTLLHLCKDVEGML
jgi:hypothetical protein